MSQGFTYSTKGVTRTLEIDTNLYFGGHVSHYNMDKEWVFIPKILQSTSFMLSIFSFSKPLKIRNRAGYYSLSKVLRMKNLSRLKSRILKYLGYIIGPVKAKSEAEVLQITNGMLPRLSEGVLVDDSKVPICLYETGVPDVFAQAEVGTEMISANKARGTIQPHSKSQK